MDFRHLWPTIDGNVCSCRNWQGFELQLGLSNGRITMKKLLLGCFAVAMLLIVPSVSEARRVWGPYGRTVVRYRAPVVVTTPRRQVIVGPAPVVVGRPVWGPQPVWVQPQPVWVSPQPTWVW
jgi:hypothetical protein